MHPWPTCTHSVSLCCTLLCIFGARLTRQVQSFLIDAHNFHFKFDISLAEATFFEPVTVLLIVFLSQLSQDQSAESLHQKAVFKLGTRLVQVARNSLLDSDSLRTYLQHLKAMYLRERAEGRGGGASQEGVGGGLEE